LKGKSKDGKYFNNEGGERERGRERERERQRRRGRRGAEEKGAPICFISNGLLVDS